MKKKINIQLASRDACTGCAACASVCPTGSITMREDKEGFLQPHIDAKTCINCHKCEKTCPIVSPITPPPDFETQAYAAINKDEAIRMRSSSGGMFHALAKWTIEQGGVVFGARFDENWDVVHDYTETLEGIEPFMRSKYVQSRIGDTFKQAKQFLEQGRWVLYSGTPCQIGGLKADLHKDYDNLLTIDFICHGVPSPMVWQGYLSWLNQDIVNINFRDKTKGWQTNPHVTIDSYNHTVSLHQKDDLYFCGFLKDIYLRKSCYDCCFKTVKRISDITLADAWGVQTYCPEMYDDKGTSAVFLHTEKGLSIVSMLTENFSQNSLSIDYVSRNNTSMTCSAKRSSTRQLFFFFYRFMGFGKWVRYVPKDSLFFRFKRKIKKIINKLHI